MEISSTAGPAGAGCGLGRERGGDERDGRQAGGHHESERPEPLRLPHGASSCSLDRNDEYYLSAPRTMRKPTPRKDRDNGPVYLRIADAIRHDILSRGLAAHTRLPSEPALVRKHRAARATVRRALAKLQDEGLVYSRQAVGTFVAEARVEQELDQLFSFSEFMVYRGIKPGSRVITAEKQRIDDPHSALLHYLGLRPGAEVIFVRRLRLGGDQPLVIANTWLPAAQVPAVPQAGPDASDRSTT